MSIVTKRILDSISRNGSTVFGQAFPKAFHQSSSFQAQGQSQNLSSVPSASLGSKSNSQDKLKEKKSPTSLLSPLEYKEFTDEFSNIVQDIGNLKGYEIMRETNSWTKKMVEYNVPQGKHFRSALMIKMAKEIRSNLTGVPLQNIYKIGWTIEFLHAYGLILDDMMDGSTTRRNEPCWYLKDNLGLAAINDGILCESLAFVLIKNYVRDHYPLYSDFVDLFHDTCLKSIHGQCLDLWISREKRYEIFNEEMCTKIMKFKNGYYTFNLPLQGALLLNGIADEKLFQLVETISLDLGIFFTAQDDYLDCFADPEISGKIGTDIEDGKCSWLVVNALKKADPKQRKLLLDNYGQNDPNKVAVVKGIYTDLKIPELYSQTQKESFGKISLDISKLPPFIPQAPLESIAGIMYKRTA